MKKHLLVSLILLCFASLKSQTQPKQLIANLGLLHKEVAIKIFGNKKIAGKVIEETALVLKVQVNPTMAVEIRKDAIETLRLGNGMEKKIALYELIPQPEIEEEIVEAKIDSNWNLVHKNVKLSVNQKKKVVGEVVAETAQDLEIKVNPTLIIIVSKKDLDWLETFHIDSNGERNSKEIYKKQAKKITRYPLDISHSCGLSPTAFGMKKKQNIYENTDILGQTFRYGIDNNISLHFHTVLMPGLFGAITSVKYTSQVPNKPIHYGVGIQGAGVLGVGAFAVLLRPIITLGTTQNFINLSPGIGTVSGTHYSLVAIAAQKQLGQNSRYYMWTDFNSFRVAGDDSAANSFLLGLRFQQNRFHVNLAYCNLNFDGDPWHLPYLNFGLRF